MLDDLLINIKKLRKQKGLTQGELADLIGVSLRQAQRWEAGEGVPEKKHITKLVEVLEYEVKSHTDDIRKESFHDLIKSILSLTESNKIAIENNTKLVETNNRLVDRLLSLEIPGSSPGGKDDEAIQAEIDKKHGVRYMKGLDKVFSDMPANVQKLADKKKRS